MHSEKGRAGLVICLLVLAAGCGQQAPPDTRAADESAIRELDAKWSRTAAANDLDGTVAFYADDATLLPPNAPAANGKQAIRGIWSSLLQPGVTVTWQVSKVDVARSGDLAYLIGTYAVAVRDPAGSDHGKLLEVWKKQADGGWKVAADIFNSDLPAAAPAPAPEKK